jgi:hypothetical protein
MSVLYVLARGSPAARRLPVMVEVAQKRGWAVVVVTSAHGRRFVDPDELAGQPRSRPSPTPSPGCAGGA